MEFKTIENKIILKISKSENVLESIKKLLEKVNIGFATIEAIGAIEDVELGYLEENGEYFKKTFNGEFELLSLKGSIAGNNIVHMHAVISGKDFIAHGGHFFGAQVSGVVEMVITKVSNEKINKIQKKEDLFPTWDLA